MSFQISKIFKIVYFLSHSMIDFNQPLPKTKNCINKQKKLKLTRSSSTFTDISFCSWINVGSSKWFATIGAWCIRRRKLKSLHTSSVWSPLETNAGKIVIISQTDENGNRRSASSKSLKINNSNCKITVIVNSYFLHFI